MPAGRESSQRLIIHGQSPGTRSTPSPAPAASDIAGRGRIHPAHPRDVNRTHHHYRDSGAACSVVGGVGVAAASIPSTPSTVARRAPGGAGCGTWNEQLRPWLAETSKVSPELSIAKD